MSDDYRKSLSGVPADSLAQLFDTAGMPSRPWSDADLGAVFRHQMSAPVEFDLNALGPGAGERLSTLAAANHLVLRSFRDLLDHPNPPLELLRMTKDFGRRLRSHPESPVPPEVASVLYFAAIACALARHRQRISRLDDKELSRGFRWSCSLPWVDDGLRTLFDQAGAMVDARV